MYNCLLCEAKEGRNLSFGSGLMELRNHNSTRREDINNCLLCVGKNKNGLNLSLDPSKLWAVRYHYASCYFNSGVYMDLGGSYLPGDHNSNEDESARDVLGTGQGGEVQVHGGWLHHELTGDVEFFLTCQGQG